MTGQWCLQWQSARPSSCERIEARRFIHGIAADAFLNSRAFQNS